ncbi:MAG TPA: sugar ABC transporter permease [Candidatus Faecousia intestinigallinarum]|nr:sugar ABC transporter permease [Candidatus Faecousia intestinigallinarum]
MAETKLAKKAPKLNKIGKKKWTRDDTELTILAIPTTIWFALFVYLPMFGIIISFKDYHLFEGMGFMGSLFKSDWVGFANFEYFFGLRDFPMILRNTILYNLVFIVLDIVLPVALAMVISNLYSKKLSKLFQTLMFMPHFMSWVVVSYFVYAFLVADKGLLNSVIRALGGQNINWYMEPKVWPYVLVFMHVWKTLGYNMVVYLASITGIDSSLYEAAVLDGASKTQQAVYVTLPSLKPIIIMMFILAVGHIFSSDFGLFYQVTQGANQPLTPVVATLDVKVFQMLNSSAVSLGQTSAASMFQAVVGCITILAANAVVRKFDKSSALI